MFTGIVAVTGRITAADRTTIHIAAPAFGDRLRMGDSIALNGVCLTVAELQSEGFGVDVMPETLHRTTLGRLHAGDAVNLEPAVVAGEPLGGHLVSGHVDAVGTVAALHEDGNARWATIAIESELLSLVAEKGSIAVDGISLTVVDVFGTAFTVSLIPHTLANTTAGSWTVGTRVNVEADVIARYVQRSLAAARTVITAVSME
ncbi:MAG: riboflavin synthase [Candidatus Dormibacteria bacterium]